jgi:L-asparagine oxygenase
VAAELGHAVEQALRDAGVEPDAVRRYVLDRPFCHLAGVFDASEDVDTPTAFVPVPETAATVEARAAALGVHAVLKLETVSYGTENDGELFVNLVVMPGKGRFADKSKSSMRGHTDGVSFPLRGDDDAEDPRVAPSPDVVTLVGLRNPNDVATTLMSLDDVLARMTDEDIFELKKRQFSMNSQLTFAQGMAELLGEPLVAHGEAVLTDRAEGTYVRYSHKNVMPTDPDARRPREASNNFAAACNAAAQGVVVKPGDILVVSNRLGLHGRAEPGVEVGGKTRWLLRAYGLDTSDLSPKKRHMGERPMHVLFP